MAWTDDPFLQESMNTYNPPATYGGPGLQMPKLPKEKPFSAFMQGGGASGAVTLGAGIATGGTGFIVAGIMQLGASLLSSMFGQKQKLQRSAEERYFDSLVKFYSGAGERSRMARTMASQITGKPAASYVGKIGYADFNDAFRQNGFTPLDKIDFGEREMYNPSQKTKKVK